MVVAMKMNGDGGGEESLGLVIRLAVDRENKGFS